MDLALLALFAALISALCQSVTDLGTKAATRHADDRAIFAAQWTIAAFLLNCACAVVYPGLLRAPVTTLTSLTKPEFWTYLGWSGLLNVAAYTSYIRAFRYSDASLVAPLALLTPVLMLVTSPIMIGEQAPPMGVFGVLFTVIGVGLLDSGRANGKRFNFTVFMRHTGARYMLLTAIIWSLTANIDKLGIRASTPLIWIAALSIVLTLCALVYWAASRQPPPSLSALRAAFIAGAGLALGSALQMWAITVLFTPYVIAIKRLSALFTIVVSGRVLKEETDERLLGAGVMLAGAVMIALARG